MRSIEEIRAEWQEILKELYAASAEYSKYIVTTPLTPGVNPEPIPFEELLIASEKVQRAEKKLKRIEEEYIEAIKREQGK
jgi:hypothetical protein